MPKEFGMTITISIPSDAEARLKQQAAEAGVAPETLAARILLQAVRTSSLSELFAGTVWVLPEWVHETVRTSTLSELFAPIRADIAKSGTTDEEWREIGRQTIAEVRTERRARRT